jgi:HEAT repeat protein
MALIKKPLSSPPSAGAEMRVDQLAEELAHDDPARRKSAVQHFAAQHFAAQHPAAQSDATELLGRRLAIEANGTVRAAILTALIKINSASAAAVLIPYLRSEDVALRNDVITALQQMPEPIAPFIPELLRDDDHDIRIFAVNIISLLRHAQAPEWLLGVIQTDPQVNVCCTAIDALAEIGTPEMLPSIRNAAQRFDNSYIRFAADVAIRRILG